MSAAVSRTSLVRLLALGLVWGSVFFFVKIAGYSFSPVQMVFARLVLGALVLLPFVYRQGGRLPRGREIWGHLLVAALLGNAIPWVLFAWGEQEGSSSVAGVVNSTTPLWTIVGAYVLGQEGRLSRARIGGLALGTAGTVIVAAPWQGASASTGSIVAFLVGTVSLGASFAYMGRFLAGRGISPLTLAAAQLTAASGLLLVAMPFAGLQPVHLRTDSLVAMAVLGAACTGFAYLLNFQLITRDGPTAAATVTVTYLFPIVSVGLGALVLGEPAGWPLYAGAIVSVGGVMLVRRKPVESGCGRRSDHNHSRAVSNA